MSDEPRLEEQALSKAAEMLLSDQLDAAQEIDVDIHTDLIEIVQGQADSVSVAGKNLVTQQDLHVQEVELHTGPIGINPFSVLFGKIELNQPVDAVGRIVVTEAEINQNLNSDYICSKLFPFELSVDGRIVSLEFQPLMELHLPSDGKMVFSSNVQVTDRGKSQQAHFTGIMYPRTPEHSVLIEGFSFDKGQAISLEIMVAFMEKLKEVINFPYLQLNGTAFRVKEMEVHKGSITLQVEAHINQLPSL